jgi:hypothetical protein
VHGAHTIGRSGFCASYRSRRGVCRGYGTFGAKEKHIFAKGRRRDSVGGRERGRYARERIEGRAVSDLAGGRRGGGRRRRSPRFRARRRVRARGATGGTPRLVGARRPVAGGRVPRETDTSATSVVFPGKCRVLNDRESGGRRRTLQHGHVAWPGAPLAALDMPPLRDRSARARGLRLGRPPRAAWSADSRSLSAGYERISRDVISSLFTFRVFVEGVSRFYTLSLSSLVSSLDGRALSDARERRRSALFFAYFPPGIPGSLKYAACPAPTARPRLP